MEEGEEIGGGRGEKKIKEREIGEKKKYERISDSATLFGLRKVH